jgi:hypothetical protein
MPIYLCPLLDSAGHFVTTKIVDCERDADVRETADILLATCGYSAIEIWDDGRQVYRARVDAPVSASRRGTGS